MMSAPSYVREVPQHHRLEAATCEQCGKIYYPPRQICPECRCRTFKKMQLSDKGKIVTYTIIHTGPSQFADQVPYAIGIIEVEPGVQLMTQIVDCESKTLEIGMSVKLEFRKVLEDGTSGIIEYGYKAIPV